MFTFFKSFALLFFTTTLYIILSPSDTYSLLSVVTVISNPFASFFSVRYNVFDVYSILFAVTVDVKDYETIKKKAEAFDKLIEIACHDGVEFYQEWNKQDVRKACKGGSVKVGEVIGKWHGEIKFTGDDGQRDFGEFVKTMIEGMDEGQLRKIIGE